MQPVAETPKSQAILGKDTLAAVRLFQSLIVDKYQVYCVMVYGSRARGTHRPDSDVDVVVLLDGERDQTMQTKFDMGDIAFDVLMETSVYISPLPIWRDQWEHPESYSNPVLLLNIARDGIEI